MFHLDGYAIAYGVALCLTVVLAARLGKCARIKGSILLVCAWLTTLSIQAWGANNSAPLMFTFLDLTMVAAFGAVWLLYNRPWALIVSGLHVGMIATHFAYVVADEPGGFVEFVYLSILAGLGYVAMGVISLPPAIRKLIGGGDEDIDYRSFIRGRHLAASDFDPGQDP